MTVRQMIVFTVPADTEWAAALPPDAQFVTLPYDDTAGGLQGAPDFEIFAARIARLLFRDLDWDREAEFKRQGTLRTEGLERDAVLASLGIPPELRNDIAAIAAHVRQAIINGPPVWRRG